MIYYSCALAGSGLIATIGVFYRVDLIKRANWPSTSTGWICSVTYLTALALLTVAWLGLSQFCLGRTLQGEPLAGVQRPTATRIVLLGLLINLVAMFTPPFLSDDSLAYSAIGRAVGLYHQPMYAPLVESLPPSDPFCKALSQYPQWLSVGSPYNPGFNWMACGVTRLAGDDRTLHLRLFQGVGLLAMLLATVVTGLAMREATLLRPAAGSTRNTDDNTQSVANGRAAQAMALVIFCPLTVIEATINAHNDSLLVLCVALFALCAVRRHPWGALAALLAGVTIKTSGVLLLGLYIMFVLAARVRGRLPRLVGSRTLLVGIAITAVVGTVAIVGPLRPWLERHSNHVALVLGSTADKYPYCTRSIECVPRGLLHIVLGMPTAAWYLGLAFRAAAGALLLYMAINSQRGVRHLTWAASFLFFFYLYFNSYSQPWYLLSLLPLLSFADPRFRPAMLTLAISNLASYALYLPLDANQAVLVRAGSELVQMLIVVGPPTLVLLATWQRTQQKPTSLDSCPPAEAPSPQSRVRRRRALPVPTLSPQHAFK